MREPAQEEGNGVAHTQCRHRVTRRIGRRPPGVQVEVALLHYTHSRIDGRQARCLLPRMSDWGREERRNIEGEFLDCHRPPSRGDVRLCVSTALPFKQSHDLGLDSNRRLANGSSPVNASLSSAPRGKRLRNVDANAPHRRLLPRRLARRPVQGRRRVRMADSALSARRDAHLCAARAGRRAVPGRGPPRRRPGLLRVSGSCPAGHQSEGVRITPGGSLAG